MTVPPRLDNEEYLVSLADLRRICRKAKKQIIGGTLFFSALACLFTLTRPVTYVAEASFREKTKPDSNDSKSLTSLLMGGGANSAESAAISTMKSHKILQDVIKNENLQAKIDYKDYRPVVVRWIARALGNVRDHLKVEYANLRRYKRPNIQEKVHPLLAQQATYTGEIPIAYDLHFINEEAFDVYDLQGYLVGQGALDQPFYTDDAAFTLVRNTEDPLKGKTLVLSLTPAPDLAKSMLKNLSVEADRLDKGLLRLVYKNDKRHSVSQQLNRIMQSYRDHLNDEQHRLASEQIAYLQQRQTEMADKLKKLLEEHAENISTNSTNIDFLIATQQGYRKKLLDIDLAIRHLQKATQEGSDYFERHSSEGDPTAVHNILSEIRKLRQQGDSIDLALRNAPPSDIVFAQESLKLQMGQLEEIRKNRSEAQEVLIALQKDQLPALEDSKLLQNPRYLVGTWYEKAGELQKAIEGGSKEQQEALQQEWSTCKDHFCSYLTNLLHILEVQSNIIEERLTHQQNPQQEFQGINLDTARELYLGYCKQLNELEAQISQNQFIIDELQNPRFEMSSLSSILTDNVSKEMIGRVSALSLSLKDANNRTSKELERIQQDMDVQRSFLAMHLKQTAQLLQLREKLLKEKVQALQSTSLELIQQQISILEKHLADLTLSRLNNLKHERSVIEQHQQELQKEMDSIPEKWASQRIVDQHMQMNQKIIHDIAGLVESKNITDKIELSQSAPLDVAVTPVYPKSPLLILWAPLGALIGAFLTTCFVLVRSVGKGIDATTENLRLCQQYVAGTLTMGSQGLTTPLLDEDLATLRRILAYHQKQRKESGDAMLLILGKGPDYTSNLAALLVKTGAKVITLPLSFDKPSNSAGLLQYLEGQSKDVKISTDPNGFDTISTGGISRFGTELTSSERFADLMDNLKNQYNWILAYTNATAASADVEPALHHFQHVVVTIVNETLEELRPYSLEARKVSFIDNAG